MWVIIVGPCMTYKPQNKVSKTQNKVYKMHNCIKIRHFDEKVCSLVIISDIFLYTRFKIFFEYHFVYIDGKAIGTVSRNY